MTFATETWAAAWRWCSLRIASSEVMLLGGEVLVDGRAHGGQPRPVLAHALQELDDEGGVEHAAAAAAARPCPAAVDPRHVGVGGPPRRAASRISSASRRRFSIRASFSMLGQAHSSPMVSGATVW